MTEELLLWMLIRDCLHAQLPVALVSVVETAGSTPRKAGAKLAVALDGRLVGTVGGGETEHQAIMTALQRLRDNAGALLLESQSETETDAGPWCGGRQRLALYPCQAKDLAVVERLIATLQQQASGRLQLSPAGIDFTAGQSSAREFQRSGADWRYQETLGLYPIAYLIGGGHVSLALSRILTTLDFYLIVLDERAELPTLQDNHYAQKKIIVPFTACHQHIPDGRNHYVMIMTPSHALDERILGQLLEKRLGYLGMLGSRTKVSTILQRRRRRFPAANLDRIHAPAGLPIPSHTPAEIAVSIAAELIQVRYATTQSGTAGQAPMPATRWLYFILNDHPVQVDLPPGLTVLEFLRDRERLTGTKAACWEGDCGSCQILLGELVDGQLHYDAVNSCLLPIGELAGRHLVTIEGLNGVELNPIQRILVECGAVQCGFCTPGLVVALTGYLLNATVIDVSSAIDNLSGNLCRCTGYAAIRAAAQELCRYFQDLSTTDRLQALIAGGVLPTYFATIAARLATLPPPDRPVTAGDVLVAGGTDLFVRQPERMRQADCRFLLRESALRGISLEAGECRIGAAMTVEEIRESPLLRSFLPSLQEDFDRFCSPPVRRRATLAGNLVNASPSGDLIIYFLALDATLALTDGQHSRRVRLQDFYPGYKQVAKRPDEWITHIGFPPPGPTQHFSYEKVGKRRYLDIASVDTASSITLAGDRMAAARLTAGGVAPVPLLLGNTISRPGAAAGRAGLGLSHAPDRSRGTAPRRCLRRQGGTGDGVGGAGGAGGTSPAQTGQAGTAARRGYAHDRQAPPVFRRLPPGREREWSTPGLRRSFLSGRRRRGRSLPSGARTVHVSRHRRLFHSECSYHRGELPDSPAAQHRLSGFRDTAGRVHHRIGH